MAVGRSAWRTDRPEVSRIGAIDPQRPDDSAGGVITAARAAEPVGGVKVGLEIQDVAQQQPPK